jgi:hypothetical protein
MAVGTCRRCKRQQRSSFEKFVTDIFLKIRENIKKSRKGSRNPCARLEDKQGLMGRTFWKRSGPVKRGVLKIFFIFHEFSKIYVSLQILQNYTTTGKSYGGLVQLGMAIEPRSLIGISSIRRCNWGVFSPYGELNGHISIPMEGSGERNHLYVCVPVPFRGSS